MHSLVNEIYHTNLHASQAFGSSPASSQRRSTIQAAPTRRRSGPTSTAHPSLAIDQHNKTPRSFFLPLTLTRCSSSSPYSNGRPAPDSKAPDTRRIRDPRGMDRGRFSPLGVGPGRRTSGNTCNCAKDLAVCLETLLTHSKAVIELGISVGLFHVQHPDKNVTSGGENPYKSLSSAARHILPRGKESSTEKMEARRETWRRTGRNGDL